MDYKTKIISRNRIRSIAFFIRTFFKDCISKDGLYVDVIKLIDIVYQKTNKSIIVEIVEDKKLKDSPGSCKPDYKGNYLIQIKESVYNGACDGIGGYRMHIMHELAHAFLCMIGYTPICERSFKNYQLRPFESMEWQAKALAGEILMDYKLTSGMTADELIDKCGVSIDSALNRVKRK